MGKEFKYKKDILRELGLCPYCGYYFNVYELSEGKRMCKKCNEKQKDINKKTRAVLHLMRVCVHCRKELEPDRINVLACLDCKNKNLKYKRISRTT